MKFSLLILMLIAWQPSFAAAEAKNGENSTCVDETGNPKKGSHCVCYMKKAVCSDGVSTCAEQVCEQKSCKADKDCAAISATCVEGFCKK